MDAGRAWSYEDIRAWLAEVRARAPKRERIEPEPEPVDDAEGIGPIEEMDRFCSQTYGT
jgi:hypothetical protein